MDANFAEILTHGRHFLNVVELMVRKLYAYFIGEKCRPEA